MGRKIDTTEVTPVTVDGESLVVEELIWDDGARSFDVTLMRGDRVILLNMDESFDSFPDDDQIRILLEPENVKKAYREYGTEL